MFTHGHTVTIITIKRCWDILINKFYLGSCYPLRSCGFFSNSLFPLTWLFKRKFFRSSFLEKVFFEKISDTTMCTWKTPPPPTHANMIQHVWHTRFSCTVLFKLMKTRKLLLLLLPLAIYLDSDDDNYGKDLNSQL